MNNDSLISLIFMALIISLVTVGLTLLLTRPFDPSKLTNVSDAVEQAIKEKKNMEEETEYLSLEECKHGWVYELNSRNLSCGVFNSETKGFTGLRRKWDDLYLFEEYHWDTGEPYGTAKPLKEVEDLSKIFQDPQKLKIYFLEKELKETQDKNWQLYRKLCQAEIELKELKDGGSKE